MTIEAANLKEKPVQPSADVMNQSVELIRGRKVAFTYASGARPLTGYTIKRGIGVGGFGEVYFAISDAGKEVALKRIQRNMDVELRGVRQCLNLKHINLISLWDICTNDAGESWVVMEFVPGDSLRDVIEQHSQGMPIADVQTWFRSSASGVQYLHNNGIVHRDLKPGNIFYDADEQVVKIGDYGLSKYISCSQRSGQTESVGTFHYMAPEIGKGVYGKEIDVYALGIILFEMLTGRLPFDGESAHEIIMKHLTCEPNLDGVPAEFRSVIFRALSKDPADRYHSIEQMMADFPVAEKGEAREYASRPARPGPSTPPPVIQPRTPAGNFSASHQDTVYLVDDIVFGPVKDVVDDIDVVHPASSAGLANEPIATAVRSTWDKVVQKWNRSGLSTPTKAALLVVAAIILIVNSGWLIPVGMLLGFLYLIYLFVRVWFLPVEMPAAKPRRISRREFRAHLRSSLNQKSVPERLMDLSGSMLVSGIVCCVFGIMAYAMLPQTQQQPNTALAAWMAACSLLIAWGVLLFGANWERVRGENLFRRFWMLVLGLLVGLASYGLYDWMMVDVTGLYVEPALGEESIRFHEQLASANGQPSLAMHLLFFAALMASIRWWRQADPVRKTRLGILSVGFCWLIALLISEIVGFPQIAASIIAVAAAASIQVSSPWIDRNRREQIRRVSALI